MVGPEHQLGTELLEKESEALNALDQEMAQRKITEEMLLGFFIHEHPDKVEVVEGLIYEAARQSPKGKAYGYANKPARITMAVPDDVVLNINGEEKKRDWYVLVRVDRAAIQELEDPSPIIKPNVGL